MEGLKGLSVAVLYSGGKDSTLALHKAVWAGCNVKALVTAQPKNPESYMFHYPCTSLTELQSSALGIPLVRVETEGEKEAEIRDLSEPLSWLKREMGIVGVVSGGIASQYQKVRIDNLCHALGLRSFAPLWGRNPEEHLAEILSLGFEVIFSGVSAQGLDFQWLGRKLDWKAFAELKRLHIRYGLDLAFEGGEAETLVLDCPLFTQRLALGRVEKVWDGFSGHLIVHEAKLQPKQP